MTPRLKTQFEGPVAEKIKADYSITNPMAMPILIPWSLALPFRFLTTHNLAILQYYQ